MTKSILMIFLLIGSKAFAQDIVYGPHARVILQVGDEIRTFSGTLIDSGEDEIRVLTCWHGTMGFQKPSFIEAHLFSSIVENTQLSANVRLAIKKSDSDKDIMLLFGPNPLKLNLKRVKISKYSLFTNTKTKSYGYGQSAKLIENDSIVLPFEFVTQGGSKILSVRAPVVYGMSGGGLLYNGELSGVQSSGKDNKVSYCPADQLLEFVK